MADEVQTTCSHSNCGRPAFWRPVVHLCLSHDPRSPFLAQELPFNLCHGCKPQFKLADWDSKDMKRFVHQLTVQHCLRPAPVRCELHFLPIAETL